VEISAQQVEELVRSVMETCPGIEGTGAGADVLVTEAIHATLEVANGIESLIKDGGFGAPVCVAIMTQGACAALLDVLFPADDLRTKLYRAGRLIGRFVADRFAEKIRSQLAPDA
jgi:hypothetical protein